MAKLHLGVIDVAYKEKNGKGTTGEVAEELEKKYHVMRVFYETYEAEINNIIIESIANEMERLMKSKSHKIANINTSKIDHLFRVFLEADEWQNISGQTIQAAKDGVSHRFKDIYNTKGKRGPRPAFIDSGTYRKAFKSWIE